MNDINTPIDAKILIRDQAEVIYHFFEVLHQKIPMEQQHLIKIVPGFYSIIKDLKARVKELEEEVEQLEKERG